MGEHYAENCVDSDCHDHIMLDPRELVHSRDFFADSFKLKYRCDAPAPLVVNGGVYVGCILDKDHEGPHEIKVTWPR